MGPIEGSPICMSDNGWRRVGHRAPHAEGSRTWKDYQPFIAIYMRSSEGDDDEDDEDEFGGAVVGGHAV